MALSAALVLAAGVSRAQQAPTSTPEAATPEQEEDVVVLSPFEVSAESERGYSAATTLAGNRLNTELRDVGNAISVVTGQMLRDTGAVNNETLLQYTTGTEVGNVYGNFTGLGDGAQLNETDQFRNPNQNTRVRGLTAADTTRDYFLSDIPWDGYNIDRVDLSRGPNSILFGQGSPAGIINAGTKPASFKNANEVELRVSSFGSTRATVDLNHVVLKDELALRITALRDHENFKQEPAFEDDERLYGALRWEPRFLKRGSARTILRANVETGEIDSNRPRSLPPGDQITPWFYTGTYNGIYKVAGPPGSKGTLPDGTQVSNNQTRVYQNLNKMTFNPHLAQNDNFYRPDVIHGVTRPAINGGPLQGYINPYFNPWAGNFGASLGGPVAYFDSNTTSTPVYVAQEIRETWGINSSGALDGGLAYDFNRLVGINPYSQYAIQAGLPNAEYGVYKNRVITDPSIFDFFNNLIDGPNKKEWQDFDVYNVSLSQTFMDDKFGFDLTYNREDYTNGQLSLLTDWRQAIYIDINRVYTDGTNPNLYEDGTPNPNLGRPFISDNGQNGNTAYDSRRESKRATAFFTHDFAENGQNASWLGRILGKHTLTGLWARDQQDTDRRNWMRWAVLDPAYRAFLNSSAKFNEGQTYVPSQVIYLGPSLLNASSAAGANIPRPEAVTSLPAGQMRVFDSHWANRPGVDPGAVWNNAMYPSTQTAQYVSTQSENPANYVGWTNFPLSITDSETSKQNRDTLTTSATLQRKRTTSKVLVWQGYLLDKAIVGTYGVRKDRAQGWIRSVNTDSPAPFTRQYGHLNLTPDVYKLPETGTDLEETSKSWSIVTHFDQLPGLSRMMERSPVKVSAFFSKSENFQPEALRVDLYGDTLPLPRGKTKDMGLLFESRDGRYSLRVNKFKTEVYNATSTALNQAAFIGTAQARGGNWANHFEYDFGSPNDANQPSGQHILAQVNNRPAGASNPPGWTPRVIPGNREWNPDEALYNYGTDIGETREMADARERAAITAWRAWQQSVDPRFYAAWGIDLNAPFRETNPTGLTSTTPNGFSITEDSVSKGYEVEFTAEPLENWRVAINAAKIEATRDNIGGAALSDFITAYENALNNTAAGDIRIWWGGAANDTALRQWYSSEGLGGEWAGRKVQEGTNVPEMREWRVNLITNYDFTEGVVKGLSVGAGVRWQSDIIIGYPPELIPGSNGGRDRLSFDLTRPYKGPEEINYDFWIGYGRKLTDKIDWRIQLNVRNAFQDDELIPITTQPDGTPAAYRIAPVQTWSIANTFRF